MDDWRKVVNKDPEGMRSREKYFWQSVIGLLAALALVFSISESGNARALELFVTWVQSGFSMDLPPQTGLMLPFFKQVSYPLGVLGFVVLTYLVIVGASNAVNLTDGLDGLAIMPVILVAASLGIFAYVTGSSTYAKYLHLPHIPGTGELLVFCGAMAGAGLGLLVVQRPPGANFYGRCGSAGPGRRAGHDCRDRAPGDRAGHHGRDFFGRGVVGDAAGGAGSSTPKNATAKGRRLLKMAPLHHHFEKSGWKETQVVTRFWIITMLLCLIGLSTLKLR